MDLGQRLHGHKASIVQPHHDGLDAVGAQPDQLRGGRGQANTPDVLRCAFGHLRLRGLRLPHDLLGGLELDSYCQSRAYAKAMPTSRQIGSDAARKNWACTSGETPQLIDIDSNWGECGLGRHPSSNDPVRMGPKYKLRNSGTHGH
jgi:hypothetical protein